MFSEVRNCFCHFFQNKQGRAWEGIIQKRRITNQIEEYSESQLFVGAFFWWGINFIKFSQKTINTSAFFCYCLPKFAFDKTYFDCHYT